MKKYMLLSRITSTSQPVMHGHAPTASDGSFSSYPSSVTLCHRVFQVYAAYNISIITETIWPRVTNLAIINLIVLKWDALGPSINRTPRCRQEVFRLGKAVVGKKSVPRF